MIQPSASWCTVTCAAPYSCPSGCKLKLTSLTPINIPTNVCHNTTPPCAAPQARAGGCARRAQCRINWRYVVPAGGQSPAGLPRAVLNTRELRRLSQAGPMCKSSALEGLGRQAARGEVRSASCDSYDYLSEVQMSLISWQRSHKRC